MKQKIVTGLVIMALMSSCKKEQINQPNPSLGTKPVPSAVLVNGKEMTDYLYYEGNSEMTTINNNMYLYLSGMQHVFSKRPEILNNLYVKIKQDYQNGLFLKQFINGTGDCVDLFNEQVAIDAPSRGTTSNHSLILADEMRYQGITYDPVIDLANFEYANFDGDYYLALAVEDNDLANIEANKDYFPAIHVNADGSTQLELLDYNAYYQRIPVFFFAFEVKQDYDYNGGKILAPRHFTEDIETYPYGYVGIDESTGLPKSPFHARPSAPVSVSTTQSIPDPGTIVHEGGYLNAHHEQSGESEYYSCERPSYGGVSGTSVWIQDVPIANVPYININTGTYTSFYDKQFVSNTNTCVAYSFLTYEYDGWPYSYKSYTLNSVVFNYQACSSNDIYECAANESPAVVPTAGSWKNYTNGPGEHKIARH